MDAHALQGLVAGGQLSGITDSVKPEWVVPTPSHQVPNPPEGYVVSFVRLHEWGFNAPTNWFMQALCFYYGVELHNFAPNAVSQAATFVAACDDSDEFSCFTDVSAVAFDFAHSRPPRRIGDRVKR